MSIVLAEFTLMLIPIALAVLIGVVVGLTSFLKYWPVWLLSFVLFSLPFALLNNIIAVFLTWCASSDPELATETVLQNASTIPMLLMFVSVGLSFVKSAHFSGYFNPFQTFASTSIIIIKYSMKPGVEYEPILAELAYYLLAFVG